MGPEATDPRRLALERILAERFGLELHRYSNALIGILLARLPAEVRGDDEATVAAIGAAFSVSETMFLRHPEQLAVLRDLLPELPAGIRGEPLRVWSAGCASGEEAYSLSAVLGAAWSRGVKVIGTDLNPALIERARAATYGKWSLRGTTPESVSAWILMTDDRAVVREPVRARVELSVLNLMADPYPEDLDVILCRNVLLYFCPSAARAVLSKMAASLRPGGVLMLGPADPPMAEIAGLTQVRSGNVLYYRAEARPRERLEPPVEEQEKTPGPPRSQEAAQPEPGAEPAAKGGGDPCEDPDRLARALAKARSLAGEQAFDGALEVLHRVVEEHPFAAEPNALAAMIALDAGRPAIALSFARRACFLEPDEPVPRYLLGVSFARLGERGAARGSLEIARADLARAGDLTRPLPCGEGLTGKQLRRLVDAYLAGP